MPLDEFPDNFPWRRNLGDEIVDLRSYIPQADDLKVTPCEVAPMALDISGVPYRVEVLDDEITPPRLRLVPPAVGDKPLLPLVAADDDGVLYHVGSVHGLLVADPARYRSETYRDWVGRFPFNESPLDDLTARDYASLGGSAATYAFNAHPDQRVWDDSRGWVLRVEPYGTAGSATFYHQQYRGIGSAFTLTMWVKLSDLRNIPMFLCYGSLHLSIEEAAPTIIGFVGDAGRTDSGATNTASMIKSSGATDVILGGDNNYPSGSAATLDTNVGTHWRKYLYPYYGRVTTLQLFGGSDSLGVTTTFAAATPEQTIYYQISRGPSATNANITFFANIVDAEAGTPVLGSQTVAPTGTNAYTFTFGAATIAVTGLTQSFVASVRSSQLTYQPLKAGESDATENHLWPVMGNHDWDGSTSGTAAYFRYFTLPNNERYYRKVFRTRGGHDELEVFFLDSDSREPDGNYVGSTQHAWFLSQLATSTARFKGVVFHHTIRSSGTRHDSNPTPEMDWGFGSLGIDFVLMGHEHSYERWEEQGIVYFTVGTGSNELSGFSSAQPEQSKSRIEHVSGGLVIKAYSDRIEFTFRDVNGVARDARTISKTVPVETAKEVVLRCRDSLSEARRPITPGAWTFIAVTLKDNVWSLGAGTSALASLPSTFTATHTFAEDEVHTDFFVFDGTANGRITLARHLIKPESVLVKVNGVAFYPALTLLGAGPKNVFAIGKFGLEGHTFIRFGDGVNGSYVPAGSEIEVTYSIRNDAMVVISDASPFFINDLHLFGAQKSVADINKVGFPSLRATNVPYTRLRLRDLAGRQEYDFHALENGLVYPQLASGTLENHEQQWAVVTRYDGQGRYTGDAQQELTGHSGRINYHPVIGVVSTQVGNTINLSAPLTSAIVVGTSSRLIVGNRQLFVGGASIGATSLTVSQAYPPILADHVLDGKTVYSAKLAAYTLGQVYNDAWDGALLHSFSQGQPLGNYSQSVVPDSNPYVRRFYVAGTVEEFIIGYVGASEANQWEVNRTDSGDQASHVPSAGAFYRPGNSEFSYRCVSWNSGTNRMTIARYVGTDSAQVNQPLALCIRGVFEVTLDVVTGVPVTRVRQLVRLSGTVTTDLPNLKDRLYTLEPWSSSGSYSNTSVVTYAGRYFLRVNAPSPVVEATPPDGEDNADVWLEVPSLEALREADFSTDAVLNFISSGSRLEVVGNANDGWSLAMQPTETLYAELTGSWSTVGSFVVTRFFNVVQSDGGTYDPSNPTDRAQFQLNNPGFSISYAAGVTTIRYGGLYGDLVEGSGDGGYISASVVTTDPNTSPVFIYATESVEVEEPNAANRYVGTSLVNGVPAIGESGQLDFANAESLPAGRYRLEVDVQNIGLLDQAFDGFQVEIEVGHTDPRTIIRGNLLSEPASQRDPRETAVLEFTLAEAITCAWTLSVRWTNDIENSDNWQRVLAIHGYTLVRLVCDRYGMTATESVVTFSEITLDQPWLDVFGNAHWRENQGAWKVALRADGQAQTWTPEAKMYSSGAKVPHALTLTASTSEKMEHISIPQSYLPDPAIVMDDTVTLTVSANGSQPYSVNSPVTIAVHSGSLSKLVGADIAWHMWDGEVIFGGTSVSKTPGIRSANVTTLEVTLFALKPNGQQLKGVITFQIKASVMITELRVDKEDEIAPYTGTATLVFADHVPEDIAVTLFRNGVSIASGTAHTGNTTAALSYTIPTAGTFTLEFAGDSASLSRNSMTTTVIGRQAVAPVLSPIIRSVPELRVGERYYPGTTTLRYQFSAYAYDPQGSDNLTTSWSITPSLPLASLEEDGGGDLVKTSVNVNMDNADPNVDYLLTCTATSAFGTVARSRLVFRPKANQGAEIDFIRLTCGQNTLTVYDSSALYKKNDSVIYRNRIYTSTYVPANSTQPESVVHPSPDKSLAFWRLVDAWSVEAGVRILLEAQASDPDNDRIYSYQWTMIRTDHGTNTGQVISGQAVVLQTLSAGCAFISAVSTGLHQFSVYTGGLSTGDPVAVYGSLPITTPRLTTAKTYYARVMSSGIIQLHLTAADAVANLNKIQLASGSYQANSAVLESKGTVTGTSQITGTLTVKDALLKATAYVLPTIVVQTRCATPYVTPAGGSQGSDQPVVVKMTCPTPGAIIRYQVGVAPTDPNRTDGQLFTPSTGRKETTLLTCPAHDINYKPLYGVEPDNVNDPFYGIWFDLVGAHGRRRFYFANYTGTGRATTPPPISGDDLDTLGMLPAAGRVEIPVTAEQLLESEVAALVQRYVDANNDFRAVLDGSGTGANVIITDEATGSREEGAVQPDSGFVYLRLTAGSLVPGTVLEVPVGQTVKAIAYRADLLESRVVEVTYSP